MPKSLDLVQAPAKTVQHHRHVEVQVSVHHQHHPVGQPPVPLLAPIDHLLATQPGSNGEAEIVTLLVRRRNRVMHELAVAVRGLRSGMEQ